MAKEKTLVLADLHLGTANTQDADVLVPWIQDVIERNHPTRVIFAGDTFETILPMEHTQSIDLGVASTIQHVVTAWEKLFAYLREGCVKELVFLCGEHDAELAREAVLNVLRRSFPLQNVVAQESWYDKASNSLIVHGHQFDYNRIFWKGSQKISCVDGLTVAINAFLSQNTEIESKLRNACERGLFSYWYAFGELPRFVDAADRLFGTDAGLYERECVRTLRGGDLDRWLEQQSDVPTRICGWAVKAAAFHPPVLLKLYDKFYKLLDFHTNWKMRRVLMGRSYPDEPKILKIAGGVRNLITGHFHDPRFWSSSGRSVCCVSCPRLSVAGIEGEYLRTFRDLDFALIEGDTLSFHHRRELNSVPCERFKN